MYHGHLRKIIRESISKSADQGQAIIEDVKLRGTAELKQTITLLEAHRSLKIAEEVLSDKELTSELSVHYCSRYWRGRCYVTIFLLIHLFQLIFLGMVALDLPYWIEFVAQDLLALLLWYLTVFKLARYEDKKYYRNEFMLRNLKKRVNNLADIKLVCQA